MHKQHLFSLFGLYAASVTLAQSPQSLLSVLQQNGFSEFAQRLQASEPVLANPGIIVYAPSNSAFGSSINVTFNATVSRRQAGAASGLESSLYFSNTIKNEYIDPSAGGQNNTSARRFRKRATSLGTVLETLYQDPSVRLGPGNNQTLVERGVPSASLPFVFSGSGKYSKVTGPDIPFDGGVVRPIDALLSLPGNLSSTLQTLGEAKFAAALQQAGLVEALENTGSITVLAPSNDVFTLSSTLTQAQLGQALKEHIIVSPSFPLYSPWLVDGLTVRTLGGTNISVVIKDDVAYLNGARILGGDSLIQNGVVHTIDKLLSGNIPTIPTSTAMITRPLPWEALTLTFIGTVVARHLLF
ncbi:FAS1 domain-containing protein [Trichoderma sp. SZMC 28015]